MINLHKNLGTGQDRTHDPWICSQTCICSHCATWPVFVCLSFQSLLLNNCVQGFGNIKTSYIVLVLGQVNGYNVLVQRKLEVSADNRLSLAKSSDNRLSPAKSLLKTSCIFQYYCILSNLSESSGILNTVIENLNKY